MALPAEPQHRRGDTPTYPSTPADLNTPNGTLFREISRYLTEIGLGGLFTVGANGEPGGWLWNEITNGADDQAKLMLDLEDTTQFKTRYAVIGEIRKQSAAGQPVHVPNVADVRAYEDTVGKVMRQAGIPSFMYDNYAKVDAYMALGLSAAEIEQRVGQSFDRVRNTDPAVRGRFNAWFGVEGDAQLAAMFLDPGHTMAQLERQSRTAYTAGMGQRFGVDIDQATADRIAGGPSTDAGIYQDLGTVGQLAGSGIFTESLGEGADLDLTAEQTGIDAVFFGDGKAQADIERRKIERNSARAAVPGGAVRTNQGLTGAGKASS